MKVVSLTITADSHGSWWLEILRCSGTDITAAVDLNQVKQTQHLISDKLLIRSTVKGSTNYGGNDMRMLYESALNVLKIRVPE